MVKQFEGTVIERRMRFDELSVNVQQDARSFADYFLSNSDKIMTTHHKMLVKKTTGVRGSELVKAVETWHGEHGTPQNTAHVQQEGQAAASEQHEEGATSEGKTGDAEDSVSRRYAKEVAQAVLLLGVLAPSKESKMADPISPTVMEVELLVPVDKRLLPEDAPVNVWTALNNASFAKQVKVHEGFMAKLTSNHGKKQYLVVDKKADRIWLFTSDIAHSPAAEVSGKGAKVSRDDKKFEHGILLVDTKDSGEEHLMDGEDRATQDAILRAMMDAGADFEGEDPPPGNLRQHAEDTGGMLRKKAHALKHRMQRSNSNSSSSSSSSSSGDEEGEGESKMDKMKEKMHSKKEDKKEKEDNQKEEDNQNQESTISKMMDKVTQWTSGSKTEDNQREHVTEGH